MKYRVKELCWRKQYWSCLDTKATVAPTILHLHLVTDYEYEVHVIPTWWDPFKE